MKKSDGTQAGNKIIAIASSTGGPKALQVVIPKIPADVGVPILIVQHMPETFTASLADRLNNLSPTQVKEAADGDILQPGQVYLSRGGRHMKIVKNGSRHIVRYSDEPPREGVRPCANYTYESLAECGYDEIVCVVLTGMGADGTAGIRNLKEKKKVTVIVQDEKSCAVYGMPRSVVLAGLTKEGYPLEQIAQEIKRSVGVN